jgi:hypothetical protein
LRCVRPLSKRSETPEGGVIERGSEKALAGWATTRSGDDAPGTAVTGSWTSHSLQLAATTEMRDIANIHAVALNVSFTKRPLQERSQI